MKHFDIEKLCQIYCECKKHRTEILEFEVFHGDSIIIQVNSCPQCEKEACEKASLNIALKLINERMKTMTTKLYETERFYVRPFEKSDITEQYRTWFHDAEVTKHNSHGLFPYTKEQMARFLAQLESSDDIVWAVIVKEKAGIQAVPGKESIPEIHIGNVTLQRINWIYRSAEFACVFGRKEYWDKGYGTETARTIFNHGFSRLNLHRIWTGTAATNIGMQRIAEKLGMKKEGVFKDAMFLNSKYVDIFEYGILESEFYKANKF